ncbi:response regulator transcription factor [Bacillus timonensis]|nr:response regulator transcription factor [Bacillus timonensis]
MVPWKVLIVDDEMLIRQGIINYINWESEGFQIVGEASNGKEAIQLIEQEHPHIVITDIVMPGMDGIELVKEIKNKYPKIEIVVLSSFENFDYVRSSFQCGVVDYILKPKLNGEDLIKTLRNIVPKEQDVTEVTYQKASIQELLNKSLLGYSRDIETNLKETLQYNHNCLVAVYRSNDRHKEVNLKPILDQLQNHVEQMNGYVISTNNVSGTIILLNYEEDQLPIIKKTVVKLAEQNSQLNDETCWMMSPPFTSMQEIKDIYEMQLLKMKDYLFFLPEEMVLIYDDLPEIDKIDHHFDLNQFISFFKHQQFNVAFEYLNEHVNDLASNYTIDIFEFKSWMENIIFNVIVLLGNMQYDTTGLEDKKYDYFSKINEAENAKKAMNYFESFLEEVRLIVLQDGKEERQTNMKLLLQYIDDYYSEPLSLTKLAKHFHFNPSYLSSYFSSHHKEGFCEYLNQVRIKKAKYILKSSKTTISRVSEMVGYSDPSYFCKVFKRIEGMSPSSYRKKIQQ